MSFLKKRPQDLQKVHALRLQKKAQGIKNEMEFVEILAQFWPLPNMSVKMERLEERLRELNAQIKAVSHVG